MVDNTPIVSRFMGTSRVMRLSWNVDEQGIGISRDINGKHIMKAS